MRKFFYLLMAGYKYEMKVTNGWIIALVVVIIVGLMLTGFYYLVQESYLFGFFLIAPSAIMAMSNVINNYGRR
jgi:hypothetical protein